MNEYNVKNNHISVQDCCSHRLDMVGWLCLASLRGHLETAPPFTVPCKGREAR